MSKHKDNPQEQKTNVMRLLEQAGVTYTAHCYADTDAVSGVEVAAVLGEPPERVFKTLVAVGRTGGHYVFIIPVAEELDLKKAARAAGEKSMEMLPAKELLPLTGYVHGGCSPIGMKKPFPTFLDATSLPLPTLLYSAGKIGWQVETTPDALLRLIGAKAADLTV